MREWRARSVYRFDWGHEEEPDWNGGECPFCKAIAGYFGGQFVECPECGRTYKDVRGKK